MPEVPRYLLLVDDDPVVLRLMAAALAPHPDLRFATSGEETLRLVREAPPELIVLDIEMPGMGGFAVCDALRADPLLKSIPVIVATSHISSAIEMAALAHGAIDFVTKPIMPAQLASRVRAQLRASRLIEQMVRGERRQPRPAPADLREQPLLLIVDDEPAAVRILRQSLASLGELHFADDGTQALHLADRLQPDLIVLDVGMPGIDGFEVCRRLKAQPAFDHVPVVFVTRFGDAASEVRALDAGAAEYIAKPYTAGVLHARVRRLLELKGRIDSQLREVAVLWRRVGDARVAEIVAAAADATLSYDAEGTIVLANAAASRLFPTHDGHWVGASIGALLGARLADLEGADGRPRRLVLARGNGQHVPVEASLSHSGEGENRLTTLVLREIAGRELLEAERSARVQMEAQVHAQSRMLSFIGHEMGNPLAGLAGFVELMTGDALHPLPPAQAARLKHIATSTEHLQALMKDLIDVGRSERCDFALDFAVLSVQRAVEDAAAAVVALAERAGVVVTCPVADADAWVRADPKRLHQCLLNLLTNAIKYNRPGGTVAVDVVVEDAAESGRSVGMAVRDDGQGMDAAQVDSLFQPFNRLGRQGSGPPGSGLGLVITRQLVLAMQGRLTVESSAGSGSCFTIVMPMAAAALDRGDTPCRRDDATA